MSTTSQRSARSGGLVLGAREPRVRLVPDYVSSAGEEAVELAAAAGLHLDPWEADVLVDALGERPDGKWAAFEVGTVVPRQNGKGSILEARELAGAVLFSEKLLIHSAHEQATSSEHFRRLLGLIEEADFQKRIKRPTYGKGSEAIEFRDGTRILFKTRTGGGGRGLTGDFVALDEAMILPEATTGALVPTMAARSIHGNPQLWYAGSAVDQEKTEHGIVLSRLRRRAASAAERLAYFEWSAEGDDPAALTASELGDERLWAQANPGLGIRISLEHIRNECGGALGPREFAVERLGVGDWPALEEDAVEDGITREMWSACEDPSSVVVDPVRFAFDVTPDRMRAAICVAGCNESSETHVEVIEHQSGTRWLPARLEELLARHDAGSVYLVARSPAAALVPKLVELGIPFEALDSGAFAQACGAFFDDVAAGTLRHLGTPELTAAALGADQRSQGEAWAWSRRSSNVDISPLVAATVARHAAVAALTVPRRSRRPVFL